MIIINAHIVGQSVQMTNLPLLASGIEGALEIRCTFSEEWDGYAKTAVFYRNEEEVFHVLLTAGEATVPAEVLTDKGSFYFGIMGTAEGGLTLTTEVLRVNLVKGAITTATAEPAGPAPNIYEELMSAYGRVDSRLNELVAMRGNGVTEQTISGDMFRGTIYSNGASAFISVEFIDAPLAAGAERTDFCIMPAFAPLGQVTLNSLPNGPQAVVTITPRSWSGTEWAGITITNPTGETLTEAVEFEGFYDLENLFNAELADVRVGADGETYASAGAAVRKQIMNIAKAATPSFKEKGAVVSCTPVESLPLDVVTHTVGGGGALTLHHTTKNLFDVNAVKSCTDNSVVNNGDGTLTVTVSTAGAGVGQTQKLSSVAPNLVVGEKYVLSAKTTGTLAYIYLVGANTRWEFGTAKTITQAMLDSLIAYYAGTPLVAVLSDIQIERGTVRTSYVPHQSETKTVNIHEGALEGTYDWTTGVLTEADGNITQLTPQPLTTFPGVNILWSSAGETEVRGSADINGVIETLTNAIIALGGNI